MRALAATFGRELCSYDIIYPISINGLSMGMSGSRHMLAGFSSSLSPVLEAWYLLKPWWQFHVRNLECWCFSMIYLFECIEPSRSTLEP